MAWFGPIVVCCVALYLRWQLADVNLNATLSPQRAGGSCAAGAFASRELVHPPAIVRGRSTPLGARQRPQLPRSPGVIVAGSSRAQTDGSDAAVRARLLAERIINGRFSAQRAPRRGKKGALDVIVVGANTVGVSTAEHLIRAGLRVLLVDRDGCGPIGAGSGTIGGTPFRAAHGCAERLPLLTGHSVCAVAERADGMLEVQAERAAWYTANVIFASTESLIDAAETPASGSAPRAA